eukprot:TRINITY_DN2160_c0_g1_i1.p1 TRINITY_DN2160_c0_g1~~TRINITY_DN2160_c0_g1_i1.p1  ORF type:complete len:206 (+),score=27.01 TRINITY_DN2160_c0_g1_i1:52-669(+)
MTLGWYFFFLTLVCISLCQSDEADFTFVTCGSMIKLRHVKTGYRLHSHEVTYGSGSGQQSVTGFPNIDDPNSFWIIREPLKKPSCIQGSSIKNGAVIRLQHYATKKYLHSHLHRSPLSQQQEVSCYPEGDTGDNWKVITVTGSEYWKRGETVRFQHVDTGNYLQSNTNKFRNPIPGQQEICCIEHPDEWTTWNSEEGFYFPLLNE